MVKLNIIGNVGSVKLYQAEGKPSVLNFDVASNRRVGGKEQTDWVACKVWYERAEKLAGHLTTFHFPRFRSCRFCPAACQGRR